MHRLEVLETMFSCSCIHQSYLFALLEWSTKGVHEATGRTCSCIFLPVRHCVSVSKWPEGNQTRGLVQYKSSPLLEKQYYEEQALTVVTQRAVY